LDAPYFYLPPAISYVHRKLHFSLVVSIVDQSQKQLAHMFRHFYLEHSKAFVAPEHVFLLLCICGKFVDVLNPTLDFRLQCSSGSGEVVAEPPPEHQVGNTATAIHIGPELGLLFDCLS
jgi:hypothetical protein